MNIKALLLVLVLSCGLLSCRASSPSEAFVISDDKLPAVTAKAEAGDLEAIKRLIAHYEASPESESVAEMWRERARSAGDPEELYYYAARLLTSSKQEADPAEKQSMLRSALDAALRSGRGRDDAATRRLIEEIQRSLQASQQ